MSIAIKILRCGGIAVLCTLAACAVPARAPQTSNSLDEGKASLPPQVTNAATTKSAVAEHEQSGGAGIENNAAEPAATKPAVVRDVAEVESVGSGKLTEGSKPKADTFSESVEPVLSEPVSNQALETPASMPANTPTNSAPYKLHGRVTLLGANGELLSPAGVIVNLIPLGFEPVPRSVKNKEITMVKKQYTPSNTAVAIGDQVLFYNGDKIKHNVFSSTQGNQFDLGTYGAKRSRQAVLETEGIVKVYCNIHHEMAAFISVTKFNLSAVSDTDGNFIIDDLESGRYQLKAWHVRGEYEQQVTLSDDLVHDLVFAIDGSSYQPKPHKNKFGKDYKKVPALFPDEFY